MLQDKVWDAASTWTSESSGSGQSPGKGAGMGRVSPCLGHPTAERQTQCLQVTLWLLMYELKWLVTGKTSKRRRDLI